MFTQSRCDRCGSILTSSYGIANRITDSGQGIWRFREFLPPLTEGNLVSLGEGSTPSIETKRLHSLTGVKRIILKLENCNPTGSFKDRVAALGVSIAKELSSKGVFNASSGNAAAAVAAYSARAGLRCITLVRENASAHKVSQIKMFSPILIRVRDLFRTRKKLENVLSMMQRWLPNWYNHFLWAPINPLLVDSFKTIAYEIFLSSRNADFVFVPVAGGDLIFGLYKGFKDLAASGLIEKVPRLVAVQAKGAESTVRAIRGELRLDEELKRTRTVASALDVSFPSEHAVIAVKESGGFGISVTDREIMEARRILASKEGIFCEISSATVVAAIRKGKEKGLLSSEDTVCAVITGSGLKDVERIKISNIPLAKNEKELRSLALHAAG
jgi:threonine synthase